MPVISIIIPIYNAEKYLNKCIESVISQTLKEIEILCVNDGSKDDSLDILREYEKKDSRIKVFTQENSGPARARNVGLENATGKYIMFCDSDDWYEPTMCEEMYKCIEKENVDLVMCDCNIIELESNHGRTKDTIGYHYLKFIGKRIVTLRLKLEINVLLWNKIFKRDLINKYGILFPNKYEHDDNSFVHQYLVVGKTYYGLNNKLYNYVLREHSIMGASFTKKNRNNRFDRFYSFAFTCEFIKNNNLLDSSHNFIKERLKKDIYFAWPFFESRKDKIKCLSLTRDILIQIPYRDSLSNILKHIEQKHYSKAIKFFDKSVGIRTFLGIKIKKEQNYRRKEYFIGQFSIFRKEKNENSKKYYICGIRVFKKRLLSPQNNVKTVSDQIWRLERNVLRNMILTEHLYYKDSKKIILLFDCLYDKDAEAIDAYTFFEYLQSKGIPSKYVLLQTNALYRKLEQEKKLQDIIIVDSQYQLISDFAHLIAQSSHIVTSFGLDNDIDTIMLKSLPSLKYIFIDHGVILLKKWVIELLYNDTRYDKILTPTRNTKNIYLDNKYWQPSQIIECGMPRWDKLKRIQHDVKNIFIFFTWRHTFEKNPQLSNDYFASIVSLINNSEIKKHNINLNIAFHHSLMLNKVRIPQFDSNINVVPSHEISRYIGQSDLLITDYSSICFDFMFLDIPVIFYRFDINNENLGDYDQQGFASAMEEDDVLYNCVYTEKDAIDKIEHYIENDFELEPENKKKNDAFFWKKEDICFTLYDKIMSNEQKQ